MHLGESTLRAASSKDPIVQVNLMDTTFTLVHNHHGKVAGQVYATLDQFFMSAVEAPFHNLDVAELIYQRNLDKNLLKDSRFLQSLKKAVHDMVDDREFMMPSAETMRRFNIYSSEVIHH